MKTRHVCGPQTCVGKTHIHIKKNEKQFTMSRQHNLHITLGVIIKLIFDNLKGKIYIFKVIFDYLHFLDYMFSHSAAFLFLMICIFFSLLLSWGNRCVLYVTTITHLISSSSCLDPFIISEFLKLTDYLMYLYMSHNTWHFVSYGKHSITTFN